MFGKSHKNCNGEIVIIYGSNEGFGEIKSSYLA